MTGPRWGASRLLLVCGVVLAVGCGSGPPLLRGAIKVEPNVNPDRAGRPSPIVVRVYELKATAAFNSADFFALFDKEQETSAASWSGARNSSCSPARAVQYRRQLQPETKFIGVVGSIPRSREGALAPGGCRSLRSASPTITIGLEARAVNDGREVSAQRAGA